MWRVLTAACVGAALAGACQAPQQIPTTLPSRPHPSQAIRDGADRGERATQALRGEFEGVDPGDTVARYRPFLEPRDRMARSNEVRVDAPRFVQVTASTRTDSVAMDRRPNAARLSLHGLRVAGRAGLHALRHHRTTHRAAGEFSPALADGRALPWGATADTGPAIDAADRSTSRTIARVRSQDLRARLLSDTVTNEAVPQHLMHAGYPIALRYAHSLSEARSPVVSDQLSAPTVRAPRKTRLVLIKSVDRPQAAPGDILTFTIQYHNIGDDPIRRVVIVDSLVQRLEYVPESATSSRKARIHTELNSLGKPEIYWHIQEPIDADAFGTVRFKAKVLSF